MVKSREFMISVSRRSVTSAYSGCARLISAARPSCAAVALGGGSTGGTTIIGVPEGASFAPNGPHRLGALPAMYATARSSESCTMNNTLNTTSLLRPGEVEHVEQDKTKKSTGAQTFFQKPVDWMACTAASVRGRALRCQAWRLMWGGG